MTLRATAAESPSEKNIKLKSDLRERTFYPFKFLKTKKPNKLQQSNNHVDYNAKLLDVALNHNFLLLGGI